MKLKVINSFMYVYQELELCRLPDEESMRGPAEEQCSHALPPGCSVAHI